MKLRRKPSDHDAIQYNDNAGEVVNFIGPGYQELIITPGKIIIQTAAAQLTLLSGQHLLKDTSDQLYVLPSLTDYEIISNGQAK